MDVRVSRFSTIHVLANSYSVHSRLIGERVRVHLYAEHLDVHYAQRHLERIPRLRGKGHHRIQYRHVIDWLVRKPGAFAHYRYREDLFPTTRFRMAYRYAVRPPCAIASQSAVPADPPPGRSRI